MIMLWNQLQNLTIKYVIQEARIINFFSKLILDLESIVKVRKEPCTLKIGYGNGGK